MSVGGHTALLMLVRAVDDNTLQRIAETSMDRNDAERTLKEIEKRISARRNGHDDNKVWRYDY